MIEVRDLTKHFGHGTALKELSFDVAEGQVCALLGPNGAGKTTLLRILATLIGPSSGEARVAGFDVRREAGEVRSRIGYMPDTFGGYEELRAEAYLQFFAHLYRLPAEAAAHTIADLFRLVDLVHLRNTVVSRLSLGGRQRLGLARALLHNPQVLLLDEPVSGLDPRARVEVRELLRELGRMGKTVLISSHVLADLADLCGQLLIIERGSLAFTGSLAELRRQVMPDRVVEVGIDGDPGAAVEILVRQSWAKDVKITAGSVLAVSLTNGEVSAADVAAALQREGLRVSRLLEQELDLEEAFLRITRGTRP